MDRIEKYEEVSGSESQRCTSVKTDIDIDPDVHSVAETLPNLALPQETQTAGGGALDLSVVRPPLKGEEYLTWGKLFAFPPFQKPSRSSLVHSSFVHSKMFHKGSFTSDPCTSE